MCLFVDDPERSLRHMRLGPNEGMSGVLRTKIRVGTAATDEI